jgi:hypothetical protein
MGHSSRIVKVRFENSDSYSVQIGATTLHVERSMYEDLSNTLDKLASQHLAQNS